MKKRTDRACRGFTLVEILAVMAVIAILAGLALGVARLASAKTERARASADLEQLSGALVEYRVTHGRYPQFNGDISSNNFNMIRRELSNYFPNLNYTDPWGNGYVYSNAPSSPLVFTLMSRGPSPADPLDDLTAGSP